MDLTELGKLAAFGDAVTSVTVISFVKELTLEMLE